MHASWGEIARVIPVVSCKHKKYLIGNIAATNHVLLIRLHMISSLSINLCFNGYPHPPPSDLCFLIEICPLSVSWLSWLSLLSLTFHIFVFSRTAGSFFQPNMAQSLLGWKEFKLCSNEGPWPYPRGDNSDIYPEPLHEPISTIKMVGDGVNNSPASCKGPCPITKGDNNNIVKIHWLWRVKRCFVKKNCVVYSKILNIRKYITRLQNINLH